MKSETERKSWDEFREAGLLWWINRILHTFGWAIVFEVGKDNAVVEIYPARVQYRGFGRESEEAGFTKVTKFMHDNAKDLLDESER